MIRIVPGKQLKKPWIGSVPSSCSKSQSDFRSKADFSVRFIHVPQGGITWAFSPQHNFQWTRRCRGTKIPHPHSSDPPVHHQPNDERRIAIVRRIKASRRERSSCREVRTPNHSRSAGKKNGFPGEKAPHVRGDPAVDSNAKKTTHHYPLW